jgi:hypothetical protein
VPAPPLQHLLAGPEVHGVGGVEVYEHLLQADERGRLLGDRQEIAGEKSADRLEHRVAVRHRRAAARVAEAQVQERSEKIMHMHLSWKDKLIGTLIRFVISVKSQVLSRRGKNTSLGDFFTLENRF